jgi:flavin reductase (DIM6/NTAB) family NADH-FMN oxidoreductase RutF
MTHDEKDFEITEIGDQLREAMRYWGSGVTIVSSVFEGERHGMTVSSFTSLSLEPPLVMVSLSVGSRTFGLVEKSGVFGITLLNHEQLEISNRFAGREPEMSDRFEGLATVALITGAPLLAEGLARMDCRVVATHPAGMNTVFFGEVLASAVAADAEQQKPLGYYNRGYRHIE